MHLKLGLLPVSVTISKETYCAIKKKKKNRESCPTLRGIGHGNSIQKHT